MYQFLIAVRQQDGQQLMNDAGETTSLVMSYPLPTRWSRLGRLADQTLGVFASHLMGFFYRTIRMVENDLKPCYVFDGKPPQLKSNVVSGKLPSVPSRGPTHPPDPNLTDSAHQNLPSRVWSGSSRSGSQDASRPRRERRRLRRLARPRTWTR